MALELVTNTTGKRSEQESLEIIAGAQAVRLVQAGETFVGSIKAVVPNVASTITAILADDGNGTDVVGAGAGELNISAMTLGAGAYIIPNRYKISKSFTSVTCGAGSLWVYYNNTIDNIGL